MAEHLISTDPVLLQLVDRFLREPAHRTYRRRAVLCKRGNEWALLCGVIESVVQEGQIAPQISHVYSNTVLFEDWLDINQMKAVIQQLSLKTSLFGEYPVPIDGVSWHRPEDWQSYMRRSGVVFSAAVSTTKLNTNYDKLVQYEQPYYPDTFEAARDWLGWPIYHGDSDARNGHLLFLFPQAEAFIRNVGFQTGHQLLVELEGTDVLSKELRLKGAYWDADGIHHLDVAVTQKSITLDVPKTADRLDLILVGPRNMVFDSRSYRRAIGVAGEGSIFNSATASRTDRIVQIASGGEGPTVEFKPFIRLKPAGTKGKQVEDSDNRKFSEVVRTVAAFANSEGGTIYFGISDDCQISGINAEVREWAEAELSLALEQYRGTLLQAINGRLHSSVRLDARILQIDERAVIEVEVATADQECLSITGDPTLYVRTGATNRSVAPEEWFSLREKLPRACNPFEFDIRSS